MKEKLVSVKKFYAENRTIIGFGVVTTLVAAVATQQIALKQHNNFLKENDLYDTYYAMEDE